MAYALGVSTRKVDRLARSLGLDGLSKSRVSEMAKTLDETVDDFRNRPLENGPYPFFQARAMPAGRCTSNVHLDVLP